MVRKFIQTTIISIYFIMFTTLATAENKIMTFSTHVQEDSVVFKTTFVLMEEAFKRLGFGFALKTFPGKRALNFSNQGKTDGEAHRIYGITNNGKYPNLVRIPEIQQIIYNYAYAFRDINLESGWEGLGAYKVAVIRGSVFLTEMSNKYAKDTQELSSLIQLLRFLKIGRADIALLSPAEIGHILEMEEFKNTNIRKIGPPLTALPIYAYLHKRHSELAPKVARTLHEMKMDGTYQRLIESVHKR